MFIVTVSTFHESGLNKMLALEDMFSPVAIFHRLLMDLARLARYYKEASVNC
jgi:hypothetical protein